MNYKHGTSGYNVFGRPFIGLKLRPISTDWGFAGWDSTIPTWLSCKFYIVNATGSYNMFNWVDVDVSGSQNGTYARVVWNRIYDNTLNWTAQFEAWDDSDTIKLTLMLETETVVNITDAYFQWYCGTGSGDVTWKTFAGQPDYVKLNTTDAKGYVPSIIKEEAYMVKNLTNTPRTILWDITAKWYWVDNNADVEYSSGETWTIELYVQYFKRYVDWDTDYVGVSDFHEPSEHNSERETYNYQNWLQLPLFNQQLGMAINRVGLNSSSLVDSSYGNEKLTLVFAGDSGESRTYEIYVGSKSGPTSVSGATSWSYSSSKKICTITVTHSGIKEVVIKWVEPEGGGGAGRYFLL